MNWTWKEAVVAYLSWCVGICFSLLKKTIKNRPELSRSDRFRINKWKDL
jgi:hypothetical protein